MDWTLTQLRSKVRELTGRLSTSDLSNSDLDDKINDFYLYVLPDEIVLPELKTFYSLTTTADDGDYSVPSTVFGIKKPITIDYDDGSGEHRLDFWQDVDAFFDAYPDDSAGGVIYNSTTQQIATGNGSMKAFSGNLSVSYVVPGSVSVTDGTETFSDDGSGTLTGDAGGSGTVDYSAATYSVTFNANVSDGQAVYITYQYTSADKPNALLLYGSTIYLRPIPDATYTVKMAAIQRPTALSADSDTVTNPKWGPVIAYGTAIQMFIDAKDMSGASDLSDIYQFHLNSVDRKNLLQLANLRSVPGF